MEIRSAKLIKWSCLPVENRGIPFIEELYGPLPDAHLEAIASVHQDDRDRLYVWFNRTLPYQRDMLQFPHLETLHLKSDSWGTVDGSQAVRQWLHERGIPYQTPVYLFYDNHKILVLPWRLLLKYWNAFAWSLGYAMFATDADCRWACMFHHEQVIQFGSYVAKSSED